MQTYFIDKSELNLKQNREQQSSQDINQLACSLKNAIFAKYISNYLIGKAEEVNKKTNLNTFSAIFEIKMWILYEQRIDKFLEEKHLDVTCHHTRPEVRYPTS